MTGRLHLVICDSFEPEVRALPPALFDDVAFSFFDDRCRNPPIEWPELEGLLAACPCCTQGKIVGSATCLQRLGPFPSVPYPVETLTMQQCLYLVAPRELVDRETQDGAYCVTPGWLAHWQVQLDRWGFDHETAVAFFAESARRVVLLDTLGDRRSQRELEAFAAAVGLPHASIHVGLEHFETSLIRIVRAWRKSERGGMPSPKVERPPQQADYALALDLLGTLFREARSEADAIQGVLDAVQMLFAPEHVRLLALRTGEVAVLHTRGAPSPQPASSDVQHRFTRCEGDHAVAPDGDGFCFRLGLGREEIGLVEVDGVSAPTAVPSYLNLALAIAPVCAAVIANSRAYDDVRQARASLERSNADLLSVNHDLQAARMELRVLQEVLPVCGWCKKILDEQGAWTRLAAYLAAYTGAEFSHGLCSECDKKYFGPAHDA